MPFGDSLEGAQPDLTGKGGEHQAKGDHGGEESVDQHFAFVTHGGEDLLRGDLAAVVNDQQREQFRQAAEYRGKNRCSGAWKTLGRTGH
ncbi:hypothetical protein D3C80_1643640 [compost metagenome]